MLFLRRIKLDDYVFMILTEKIKSSIKEQAMKKMDEEICGLLYLDEEDIVLYPCENIAENPNKFFSISGESYLRCSKLGKIVAVYHSHLNNNGFSEFDKLNSERHKIHFIIYSTTADDFYYYEPCGYDIPLLSRSYVVGYMDCFSLVKDYYKQKCNIILPELTHPYRFVSSKDSHPENDRVYNILPDFFKDNGFACVTNLKKHDLILCKTAKIPSPVHSLIYIGENQVIHHPREQKATVEPFHFIIKQAITHTMRHKSLI